MATTLVHKIITIYGIWSYRQRWMGESEWLEWVAQDKSIRLQTSDNGGQIRIGPFLVDGFCSDKNTILEFYDCFYHSCTAC